MYIDLYDTSVVGCSNKTDRDSNSECKKKCKPRKCLIYTFYWRRDRDSNPGYLAVQRFSRPPQSTTLPPLQNFLSEVLFVESVAKVRLYFKYARLLNKKN